MFIGGKLIHPDVTGVSIRSKTWFPSHLHFDMRTNVDGILIQQCLSLFKTLCAVSTSDMYQVWSPSFLQSFRNGNYECLLSHRLKFPFITSCNLSLHYSFYMNTVTKSSSLPKIEFLFLPCFVSGILLKNILDKNI